MEVDKIYHNCFGTGNVPTKRRLKKYPDIEYSGKCYYCFGTGRRKNNYVRG